MKKKIILASSSPRRIELLEAAGYDPIIIPANIDEVVSSAFSPAETVMHLAFQKASYVRRTLNNIMGMMDEVSEKADFDDRETIRTSLLAENLPVIGADTIVYFSEKSEDEKEPNGCNPSEDSAGFGIIGKPKDREDALDILMRLSGKAHKVYTGVAILPLLTSDEDEIFYDETTVYFKSYTPEDLLEYLDTDEPYDKAGAYAIQGYFGRFIDHIEGDYDNVMGLPLYRVIEHLRKNNL